MTLALSLWFYWLGLVVLNRFAETPTEKMKWLTLLLLTPFVIYPFEFGPVWWLRGLTGDLSITTLLLLLIALYQQLFAQQLLAKNEKRILWQGIVITGTVFYPLALGLGNFDPYGLGYHNGYFISAILLMSLVAFIFQYFALALVLAGAVLAWNVQLLQSGNLWDYLIDPFVFFFCLGGIIKWKR